MSIAARWSYARAGVSIDRGNRLVRRIARLARQTARPGVVGAIGGFSAFFDPSPLHLSSPLLVATTDGVGTKLELAQLRGEHGTVGIDLVAMCVNDLICTGARPLFFLDYFACGKLDLPAAGAVMKGIVKGCREAGCALIGGETAEMPEFYAGKKYDLAGFAVGMVPRKGVIDGSGIRAGDDVLGLSSSGFHSNGYSLLRRLFSRRELAGPGGRRFLRPTRIYVRAVLTLASRIRLKGIAHITGGAFLEKIPRILPDGLAAVLDTTSWPVPRMFSEAARRGRLSARELYRTFNMGVGMVIVIAPKDVRAAGLILRGLGMPHWRIGEIAEYRRRGERVVLKGAKA